MSFNNKYTIYYTVDIEQNMSSENIDANFNSHMLTFVEDKLSRLYFSENHREYSKISDTTQVISMLNKIVINEDDNERKIASQVIANRLLREEISVQARISQLNREVQRGGLIIPIFLISVLSSIF